MEGVEDVETEGPEEETVLEEEANTEKEVTKSVDEVEEEVF